MGTEYIALVHGIHDSDDASSVFWGLELKRCMHVSE